jgi:hypothetical protein
LESWTLSGAILASIFDQNESQLPCQSAFRRLASDANAAETRYSLIETAKVNELNPYAYLSCVFSQLSGVEASRALRTLLPTNITPEDINSPAFARVGGN